MNHELKIVKTADGSNTIYNAEVGENYHSKHGALQESRHVFINAGLCYFLNKQAPSKSPPVGETLAASMVSFEISKPIDGSALDLLPNQYTVPNGRGSLKKSEVEVSPTGRDLDGAVVDTNVSILEVGFGTGLNFLLSADLCTERKISLDYTGIEAYPLSLELISQTGYDQYISPGLWTDFINKYADGLMSPVSLNQYNKLQIANCKLLNFQSEKQYDIIYFDAFAVARQPEMWDEVAINHTIQFLKPGGVFVTYAITGNLKRALKALGCKVEKAPGAPGKREMLRAVKPGPLI